MTEVAYPTLFQKDSVAAFDKVLRECFLPLFAWTQGHHKRGSIDPLLSDARLALLAHMYAPNLFVCRGVRAYDICLCLCDHVWLCVCV